METLFMIFMIFVTCMVIFAVMVVVRDIVKESYANKRAQTAEEVKVVEKIVEVEKPVVVEAPAQEEPVKEPVIEEVAVAVEPEVEAEDDGKISFSAGNQQTLDEKYLELSAQAKSWYDELVKIANLVEGSKRIKNARYEEYKVGNSRVIRLTIKRGIIQTEFVLHNSDFKNFVNENKISVKQSATVIKLVDEASFEAAKNSISIVLEQIAEEKEYKKQLAREKRRAKNKKD
ncbi:MAG: hypothetical protein IKJ14_02340 [Clostridia bacterium]|nr:hypothetical protein [Clostridia bacterium]